MQSDKQTILASFGQLNRHERFQIITKIVKDGSKALSEKKRTQQNHKITSSPLLQITKLSPKL